MQAQANILTSILNRGYEDTGSNTSQLMRQLVENFDKKETLELMAINLDGDVALTSSGFSLSEKIDMPDFEEALKSDDGTGSYTGSYGREKIMAYTVLVQSQNNAYSAIRLVSSLDKVNSHINTVITMFVSVSAAIILIVFLSGMYFIN